MPRSRTAQPDQSAALDAAVGPPGVEEASVRFIHDVAPSVAAAWAPHRPARPAKSEGGRKFNLVAPYQPAGDQPTAIADLVAAIIGCATGTQVLLGVTGSGKTFTMASKSSRRLQRPALILAPNKILAAQLVRRIQKLLPRQRGRIFRQRTTTITSPKPTSRALTPTSKRKAR